MERAIGEIFKFEGKWLKVIKGYVRCKECFFYEVSCPCRAFEDIRGECTAEGREDGNNVYFIRA